eukprot:CAMPEP_0198738142 /NCGR_PEP_ID=MMETSP1475-20131203/68224_1 /TAXON_ID= ORGANISM="Unidentified sp., Strain CCMP1999" /NCGR_SAMPLE_ID=MMETSP1475 /ASSEMBLY_ACC=CAM_ASM_001111 /LENGTH=36 /DNA_ID= /DNA_START= /DNA_END= /DNA_ORIENTATION=
MPPFYSEKILASSPAGGLRQPLAVEARRKRTIVVTE